MPAKLMYRFTEENPDSLKRIGCVNGIFQRFVIGRGRANQKRLPAVAQSDNGDKQTKGTLQAVKDKNQKKPIKEKQRPSSESSRTSCSSSCSSTFSSMDCNRASQLEVSSFASETMSRSLTTKQSGRQDLRDAVKESIKRETRGLSINSTKREDKSHTIKHIDSPRPMKLSSCTKPKVANINEAKNSRNLSPIDGPRFSYDERESRQKSNIKLKELPRLSLDSRAGSMKSQSSFRNEMEYTNTRRSFNSQEEPEKFNRPSSVVAKLMGLDSLPTIEVSNEGKLGKPFQDKDLEYFPSASSVTRNDVYQNRMAGSPIYSEQVDVSPSLGNADLVRKVNSSLRTPIQPFPLKKLDGSQGLPKPAPKHLKTHTITSNSRPSVYGEIAKKLSELEVGKSGKDLRALQRILETMQKTKEILQNNQYQFSDSMHHTHNTPSLSSHEQTPKLGNPKNVQNKPSISVKINQISPQKNSESPIVIMKPATLVRKSSNLASTIVPIEAYPGRLRKLGTNGLADKQNTFVDRRTQNDLTPKENVRVPSNGLHCTKYCNRLKTDQTSKVAQQTTVESPGSSRRISGALSPRLQRKQLLLEKQSHPTITSSDSRKLRRQSTRLMIESNSPRERTRSISPRLQRIDDQLRETSCITTSSNHQGDAMSPKSDGTTSFLSRNDADILSTGDSEEIISAFYQQVGKKHQSPAVVKWTENGSTAKLALTTTEQPSPVSVLGAIFYDDDLPSPVKKITLAFEDDGTLSCDESVLTSSASYHISESTESNLSFDAAGHLILENSRQSVQNLGQLSYSQVEASVDWNKNEDHKYIFEILLASGLLSRDLGSLMSTELHPTGYIINPDLFLVLEQTIKFSHDEPIGKIHRNLVFDALNEILVSKVLSQNKVTGRIRNKQPILKEVCAEIGHLLASNSNGSLEDGDTISHILQEELKQPSSNWEDLGSDISVVELDIERSIFRDLVTEVVDGEAARIQGRLGRHRRKLSVN